MAYRRTGLGPLNYMGVEPVSLAADVAHPRSPTKNDINFNLSTRWLNTVEQELWVLVNLDAGIATWVLLAVGGEGAINSLTTDDSVKVVADSNGNINLHGTHGLNTTGDNTTHTATVAINNAITLGDLADITASAALTLQTGFLYVVNDNVLVGNTNANVSPSIIEFLKDRNGGAVVSGDFLGNLSFLGNDGANYVVGAGILSQTSGVIAPDEVPADLQFYTHPNSAVADPTLRMVIDPNGDVTINAPDSGDALTVTGNIAVPNTNTSASEGIIKYGNNRFVSNYGANNTFIGSLSGNTSLTTASAANNTALGSNTLPVLTTGDQNSALGSFSLNSVTTGSDNTALGYDALTSVTTGSFNTAVGYQVGSAYTGAETSNILIGSPGVVTENNSLRIGGGTGTGDGEQSTAYMSGINGNTVGSPMFVTIDMATDQLGTTAVSPMAGLIGVSSQVFTTSGTYTPTTGMAYCIIEVVGGGGGGGALGVSTGLIGAAGGGAGGGYSRGLFTAATIGVSQVVTVGAAGAGGAAGSNDGTAGGTSSVGALISATGGGGGFHSNVLSTVGSTLGNNAPGVGSGGSLNCSGSVGENGWFGFIASSFIYFPGTGGPSVMGGGGGSGSAAGSTGSSGASAGLPAGNYGGGGGGAGAVNNAVGAAGGNGGAGIVYITEFIG